jgi:DNA-binding CsgD family transcriptional regulator
MSNDSLGLAALPAIAAGGACFALPVAFPAFLEDGFANLLDQIDYGLLLLDADQVPSYANRAARAMLAQDHPLEMRNGELEAREPGDAPRVRKALQAALRGLRTLLTLGMGERRSCVAIVPLPSSDSSAQGILLVLGKRSVCEGLSAQWYARSHGLTPAETQVLTLLCSGALPNQIALRQGVAISTIRTQIGSIRAKTGARTIGALLRDVAVLPPLVHALEPESTALTRVH